MTLSFGTRPLIIKIERGADGEWDIHPSSSDRLNPLDPTSLKHSEEMMRRANNRTTSTRNTWQSRRAAGAPNLPHYLREVGHVPIAIFPGEKVQFQCEVRNFTIWVERDPNVSIAVGSPENPLGFRLPQSFTTGNSADYTVLDNIEGQRFYKCTAWVELPEGTVKVDPDLLGLDEGGIG